MHIQYGPAELLIENVTIARSSRFANESLRGSIISP